MNNSLIGMHCAESSSSNSSAVSTSSTSSRSRQSHHNNNNNANSDALSTSSNGTTNTTTSHGNPGGGTKSIPDASSSSSSSTNARTTSGTRRIRTIRLTRPNSSATSRRSVLISTTQSTAFGFAIRGGREFSIGFFVSRIEKGSEADAKGLRVII